MAAPGLGWQLLQLVQHTHKTLLPCVLKLIRQILSVKNSKFLPLNKSIISVSPKHALGSHPSRKACLIAAMKTLNLSSVSLLPLKDRP